MAAAQKPASYLMILNCSLAFRSPADECFNQEFYIQFFNYILSDRAYKWFFVR